MYSPPHPPKESLQHKNNGVKIFVHNLNEIVGKKWLLMAWVLQDDPEIKGQCLQWKSLIFYVQVHV
jgi:hypothetical protein